MMLTLTIIHVVIAVILVVTVLMQQGKQQGMSGAIAGGAETFFGKNKGRTIDAMLKKFTAVIAILFVISSLVLTAFSVKEYKGSISEDSVSEDVDATEQSDVSDGQATVTVDENGNLVDGNGNIVGSFDESGNLVDTEGNVLATADELAESAAEDSSATESEADGEAVADETPAAE